MATVTVLYHSLSFAVLHFYACLYVNTRVLMLNLCHTKFSRIICLLSTFRGRMSQNNPLNTLK